MSVFQNPVEAVAYEQPFERTLVHLLSASALLTARYEVFLKTYQLTRSQYIVLRILWAAHCSGLTLSQRDVQRYMLDRVAPDMTRLLARMEQMELIERQLASPESHDQRLVLVHITPRGIALLEDIEPALRSRTKQVSQVLTPKEQATLTGLLTRLKASLASQAEEEAR